VRILALGLLTDVDLTLILGLDASDKENEPRKNLFFFDVNDLPAPGDLKRPAKPQMKV